MSEVCLAGGLEYVCSLPLSQMFLSQCFFYFFASGGGVFLSFFSFEVSQNLVYLHNWMQSVVKTVCVLMIFCLTLTLHNFLLIPHSLSLSLSLSPSLLA